MECLLSFPTTSSHDDENTDDDKWFYVWWGCANMPCIFGHIKWHRQSKTVCIQIKYNNQIKKTLIVKYQVSINSTVTLYKVYHHRCEQYWKSL